MEQAFGIDYTSGRPVKVAWDDFVLPKHLVSDIVTVEKKGTKKPQKFKPL